MDKTKEQLMQIVSELKLADDISNGARGQLDSEDIRLRAADSAIMTTLPSVAKAAQDFVRDHKPLIEGVANPNIKPGGLSHLSTADWDALSTQIRTQFPQGVSDELRKRAGLPAR